MSKPREWWIVDSNVGIHVQTIGPSIDAEGYLIDDGLIYTHVIEHSAYRAVVTELKQAYQIMHDLLEVSNGCPQAPNAITWQMFETRKERIQDKARAALEEK